MGIAGSVVTMAIFVTYYYVSRGPVDISDVLACLIFDLPFSILVAYAVVRGIWRKRLAAAQKSVAPAPSTIGPASK